MRSFSTLTQCTICIILALLMAATRGYHFMTIEGLPSASWAVFFLAGVYLRSRWVFPALLAEAVLLDFAAITWGGVSTFCITLAYGFLLPAYGALWFAGHYYADRHRDTAMTLIPLTMSGLIGTALCEVISSGGFYFFSGRFDDTNLTDFATQFSQYFPQSLSSLMFYVGIAAILHVAFGAASTLTTPIDRLRTSD